MMTSFDGRTLMQMKSYLLVFALFFTPLTAEGAEITVAPEGAACQITLKGPIVAGDRARLLAAMDQVADRLPSGAAPATLQQVGRRVCLDSPGGALAEGVALAVLLHERVFGTLVERDGTCLSACAVAFMGGTAYDDTTVPPFPDRVMHPTARLGFHAPSLSVPKGRYSADVVDEAYVTALRSLAVLQREMQRLNFPISLITTMLDTPPETFTEISTVGAATRLGISVAPVPSPEELTPMAANLACSHAQSQALDAPFFYLENIGEIEPDSSGRRMEAQEMLGYGSDGLWGCELWLWPRDRGEEENYTRRPTSIAGRVAVGNYRLLSPVMFWPPEMALRDLALAEDAVAESAVPQEVVQTTARPGLCLRADATPVLLETFPCIETVVETWTEAGDYQSQKRFHSETQDLLRYDWIVTRSAEGEEALREEVNGQPLQQDWNDYGSGQEYSLSLYNLAESSVDLAVPDANCLPETASTAFCFLTKD